ncbi:MULTISPECIES: Asp23/Gls24 family envelope stress response protein [unclassified Arthrobacter]|uniref:Asp23/Gls24 family envelope stress response protein n=1 Tax=unclassified Arthrobacter TaxID=235627 RepID=UPI000CE37873|nr:MULTISPECIES: Asp23/Gls24 family envelope stress response protein [unclassified Arthrobacter]
MTTQPQIKNNASGNSASTNSGTNSAKQTVTSRGTTTVADGVVAKVAGIAAQDIPGVYALGGGAARALGSIREAVGQKDLTQGVSVEVGQTQVAVDVTLVVEYPHPLQKVADAVRDAIYAAVEDVVGMEVTEVNVSITDIHIPSDDDEKPAANKRTDAAVEDQGIQREARVS